MDILGTVWFCLLAALGFGFVIFIHELGHFLFAKWAGVRVDRFSIGFGPVIIRKQIGETEYALSLLPLGGYVKMLGQEDTPTEITGEAKTDPRSYLAKSWKWQALILLGGVLFNLISSYLILLGLAWWGKPTIQPVVGEIQAEVIDEQGHRQPSPAVRLGLRLGDRILTLNGDKIREFDNLFMGVVASGTDPLVLTVERRDEQGDVQILRLPPEGPGVPAAPDFREGRLTLGIKPMSGTTVIDAADASGDVPPGAPRRHERIVAIDGTPVPASLNGLQLRDRLAPLVGSEVAFTFAGDAGERTVTLPYAGEFFDQEMALGFPALIASLVDGADPDGLKPGDVIVSVDGKPVTGRAGFIGATRVPLNAGRPMTIRVWRAGKEIDLTLTGRDLHGRSMMGVQPIAVSGYLPVLPTMDGKPSPLAEAGIRPGDAIIQITPDKKDPLKPVEMAVVSGGERVLIGLSPDDSVAIQKSEQPWRIARLLGATGTPSLISALSGKRIVRVDGPALEFTTRDGIAGSQAPRELSEAGWRALAEGLKPGDWVTGIVPFTNRSVAVEVIRGAGEVRSVTVTPRDLGVQILLQPTALATYELESWTEAFAIANTAAYAMVVKTLQLIPRFFTPTRDGGLDPNKSLTGPIGIFTALKGSVEMLGFARFLELVALIGLNLFLINLLPIPITDGGQLMFLAIETVTGRPLAPWARNFAMYIGLVMVLMLMVYVIGLDLLRVIGLH
jgi:regulator of sigma E protease